MKGQKIGYIRVSTIDQNIDRQLEGMQLDRVFIDKISGKTLNRPQLEEMIKYVREGDHLYVHSMDRLARNLMHLREIVQKLNQKKVIVHFLKENLIFTGDDSPMNVLLLSMMGAFAEFEYSFIKERQREGIALAKQRGAFKKAGRKKMLSKDQFIELTEMVQKGIKKTQIAKHFKMSRTGIYKYLKVHANGMD